MIGEIIPEIYDVEGRAVSAPYSRKRRRLFHATFPIKRYLSQPLSVKCSNMKELREFLDGCSYVSDMEQFNMKDYWMPPEDFEQSVEDYVSSFHSRNGFSRDRMSEENARQFDAEVSSLVRPFADDGMLRTVVRATATWGVPLAT